ncbi:MAG: hypothetical protein J6K21_01175 [Bacilli bacterium]|nr:hypothetical protein [Bacilli bacterium]
MEIKQINKKIFIISGKARHGKNTVSDIIKEYYESKNMKTINDSYAYYIKDYARRISNWDGSEETKPRELLQQLGTNLIREKIDKLFFINRMIEDLKVFSYFYDIITISDGRFEEELDIIKNKFDNVILIKVDRPNFDNGLTEEQKKHPTETSLDNYKKFDYIIENDSTIEKLKEKVEQVLKEVE